MKTLCMFTVICSLMIGVSGFAWASEPIPVEIHSSQASIYLLPKASVLYPVATRNATQRVFLTVRDQNLKPIQGAASLLTVSFPNEVQTWLMPLTDVNGVSHLDISLRNQIVGSQVVLEFQVVFGELEAITRDSFRIWW